MGLPEPVTPPERDLGRRTQTAFDLEVTLVGFLSKLFDSYRLDNPTLNLSQATAPEQLNPSMNLPQTSAGVITPRIVRGPDDPPVSYDPTERMQTLALKVPPRVVRGRIPRTVTGEIDLNKLADVPNVIVQAIKAKIEIEETIATVRILFSTYDENPDSSGYQDCLNLIETAALALTSFGQQAIDKAYPIKMPIEWEMIEADCFPHFVAVMTTTWELPSARPLPDSDVFGIIPAEHIDLRVSVSNDFTPLFKDEDTEQPPIDRPPVEPKPDVYVATFTPSKVFPSSDLIMVGGLFVGDEIRFESQTPLPQPLVQGVYYFVVTATDVQFQISETRGGPVLDLETSGAGQNDIWKKVS